MEWKIFNVIRVDSATLVFCRLEIFLNSKNRRSPIEIGRTLKVVIKTAVIQINRSDNSPTIVTHKYLCMNKSRSVLIDFYAGCQKCWVVSLSEVVS